MGKLASITEKYQNDKIDDLRPSQLEDLQAELKGIYEEDITSLSDAKTFLDLLGSFRKTIARVDKLNGEEYVKLIRSILSVGEDGVYSDPNRFLYELIQNVDDCDYNDLSECKLNITFDIAADLLILEYNEKGFEPFNVYAITGIAERAKNVDKFKKEIGEKGIGFKSVFGVANKVLIQSGLFSFEINKENFTIPIPVYDNYKRTEGTKLTIYLPEGKAENLYRDFVECYCKDDAIFNKNPLLFLNKLTELNFYVDGFRYMKFKVTRPSLSGNFVIGDALLSVELRDPKKNNGEIISNTINCVWFSQPVIYDDFACQSRYGKDTALSEKQLTIAIVVPKAEDIKKVSGGTLYSYLPTQIKLKIPAAIHMPFKLDASREFVDPQGNNSWFCSSYIGFSGLLKEAYKRLAGTVKEQIVYYLPKSAGSIFDGDNEKVNCLKCLGDFKREKLLALPIFYVNKEKYVSSSEIVCISDKECKEPKRAYSILNLKEELFIPPKGSDPQRAGLKVIENINGKILEAALKNAGVIKVALDYLCSLEEFPFKYEDIDGEYTLKISQVIEIIRHEKVYDLFEENAIKKVKGSMRPQYSVAQPLLADIRRYLEFTEGEVPGKVKNYLKLYNYNCVPVDSEKSFFFAAYNAVVLSKKGAIDVFSNFILAIDKDSGFAIDRKLKKFSEELNNLEKDDSVTDICYLQKLTENRRSVKSVLGKDAYKNYVDIVNNSGNNNLRFINELLQNADDCDYPEGVEPEFSLTYSDKQMITDCNEGGFTRADVRAITAIGDSTKTKLIRKEHNPTGEKGIGFKTVFSVAEDVTIISGRFLFKLTAEEPTIPIMNESKSGIAKDGTSMLFSLKQSLPANLFDKEKVLKLCLCLRKLKKITLGKYVIEIEDDGEVKKVTINGESHIFSKHVHCFEVTDALAIEEREKNGKKVKNTTQYIYCYYGGKTDKKEGLLYNVLPTQINLNIPLYIDAPFMLTTSRDHVLNNNSWNNVILHNVYEAIKKVIFAKKEELRSGVLELTGIGSKNENGKPEYYNNIFTDSNLNSPRWLYDICGVNFLPTFDKSVFVAPCDSKCRRYPAPANYILRKGETFYVPSSCIIDALVDGYEPVFNALHVKAEEPERVLSVIKPFIYTYMDDKQFRESLYKYIKESKKSVPCDLLHKLPVIPVYGNGEQRDYICWQKDKIFIKDDEGGLAEDYKGDYYLLNESILSKSDCESMLGVNIDRMNLAYIQKKYRDEFTEKYNCLFGKDLYEYILKEYKTGNLARFDCMDKVGKKEREDNLPLKNVNGEIVSCRLFINEKSDYIRGGIFDRLSVHSECLDLAKEAGCESLFNIHYGFIASCLKQDLTADDIETLKDDKLFVNGRELLFCFVSDGYVSDELIQKNNLEYYQSDYDKEESIKGEIPNNPVKDIARLSARIREVWEDPRKIVDVQEIRYVKKIEYKGKKSDINYNDLRYDIIGRYRSENNSKKCVCQMCKTVKDSKFIEVNNIEAEPEYYWEQMRIALCLECSKLFEEMRSDVSLMRIFKENILAADSQSDEPVYVSIDNYLYGITFTQTHLAEIQEILKLQDSLT